MVYICRLYLPVFADFTVQCIIIFICHLYSFQWILTVYVLCPLKIFFFCIGLFYVIQALIFALCVLNVFSCLLTSIVSFIVRSFSVYIVKCSWSECFFWKFLKMGYWNCLDLPTDANLEWRHFLSEILRVWTILSDLNWFWSKIDILCY